MNHPYTQRREAIRLNKHGESLFNDGRYAEAFEVFSRVVQMDPRLAEGHNNLGVYHHYKGDAKNALACFKRALEIDPFHRDAIDNLYHLFPALNKKKNTDPSLQPLSLTPQRHEKKTINNANQKPTLRILHHMARSGGTIISKCLGCMSDIILLSEIHPLGVHWYEPVSQAHKWFNLLTATDIQTLQEQKKNRFEDAIALIQKRCMEQKKTLVIRDWSHLDFTAIPFLEKPSYRRLTAEVLRTDFYIFCFATVRHPIDQWLSLLRLALLKGKIKLDQFLRGYLRFAECCREIGFIRYEDFTASPEREMKFLCESLSLQYDPKFIQNWSSYTTITGDNHSERGHKRKIRFLPRRCTAAGLIDQFEKNPDYLKSIEILGYGHPYP